MFRLKAALGAGAIAVIIATGVTLATASGGATKEVGPDESCSHAAWPMIPAQCLDGANGRDIRYALAGEATGTAMAERFAVAFRADSSKPATLKR